MSSAIVSFLQETFGWQDERFHAVFTFVLQVAFLAVVALARPLAYAVPFIRRWLNPDEQYAGDYIQIISSNSVRRYSLLKISYRPKFSRYLLRGIQYDDKGHRVADFESENVTVRHSTIDSIEFVWRSETIVEKERFDGFTQMTPDPADDNKLLSGRGFFITFHNSPIRFDLRFLKLTSGRLRDLDLQMPHTEAERAVFVQSLNERLRNAPHLAPFEDYGKPLI